MVSRIRAVFFSFILPLVVIACGGDSPSATPTPTPAPATPAPTPDITVDAFSFDAVTNAERNASVPSSPITVSGIDTPVAISITGGEYRIGDQGDFTDAEGTVSVGNIVTVRTTAAAGFSDTTTATLTIGDQSAPFSVTTLGRDILPNDFTFTPAIDRTRGETAMSGEVTIEGINDDADVTVTGGEYRIQNGNYTSEPGTISDDQTLELRGVASSNFGGAVEVVVTVGSAQPVTFVINTEAQDLEPNDVEFEPKTDQLAGDEVDSNVVDITGINDTASVTITGGMFKIDDGDFTSEPSTITDGQSLQLRVNASTDFEGQQVAVVTVGTREERFTVTTEARDTQPNDFGFESVSNADFNVLYPSNVVTISSTNDDTTISVSAGGEYSIDGGTTFTSVAGNVAPGSQVAVRGNSSATPGTSETYTLTIGGVEGTFTITTMADNTAPTATIAFPPPSSLTEGDTIYVRGTASDELSTVTQVQVNGVDVVPTGDGGSFATWEIEDLPLADGENTIVVRTWDSAGNSSDGEGGAASVSVLSDENAATIDFPSADHPLLRPVSFVLDYSVDPPRALIGDEVADSILSMNLETGVRDTFSDNTGDNAAAPLNSPGSITFDSNGTSAWVVDSNNLALYEMSLVDGGRRLKSDGFSGDFQFFVPVGSVLNPLNDQELLVADDIYGITAVNLDSGTRSIFSSSNASRGLKPADNGGDSFANVNWIIYEEDRERLLVNDSDVGIVIVNRETGARDFLSSDTDPDSGGIDFGIGRSSALDAERDRLLVADSSRRRVIAVDLTDGDKSILSDSGGINAFLDPRAIYFDDNFGYAFVTDDDTNSVMAVDILKGHRVFISKANTLPR